MALWETARCVLRTKDGGILHVFSALMHWRYSLIHKQPVSGPEPAERDSTHRVRSSAWLFSINQAGRRYLE